MLSPNVNSSEALSSPQIQSILAWVDLTDADLLRLKFKDLQLNLASSSVQALSNQLLAELQDRGFQHLKPKFFVGDDWFTPENSGFISVPFYLMHPRLMALEKQIMGNIEGATRDEAMRILRHEAGHCFDHAFHVSATRKWRQLFGDRSKPYRPEHYHANPNNRSFVIYLRDNYAQAHPDEDFAETFAVWLDPESNWQQRYRDWPQALSKLEYVQDVATYYLNQKPQYTSPRPMSVVAKLNTTLARHYHRRLRDRAAH